MFVELLSKRDKKVEIRKNDDEILEELIAHEDLIIKLKAQHIPNKANENISNLSAVLPIRQKFSIKTVTYHAWEYDLDKACSVLDLVDGDLEKVVYNDLLKCFEWRFRRLQILIRDNFSCRKCGI